LSAPAESLARVEALLSPLGLRVVYVGGMTTGLYLDPVTAASVRTTVDVDCVVPVDSVSSHAHLEERLRGLGLQHGTEPGDPICRWRYEDLVLDILPKDPSVLGFSNPFHATGYDAARPVRLPDGTEVWIMDPLHALAAKTLAFRDRGAQDPYESRDLEDIVTLLDGCAELPALLASATGHLLQAVAEFAESLLADGRCDDLLLGHVPRGSDVSERARRIRGLLSDVVSRREAEADRS
jgi:predicted nucleotidyltransferase